MPFADPEKRRQYNAEYQRRYIEDPNNREKAQESQRKYEASHREKRNEKNRTWYHEQGGKESTQKRKGYSTKEEREAALVAHRAERAAWMREYNKTESGKRAKLKQVLKRRCGMTLEQYDGAYEKQEGRCAICKTQRPKYGHNRLAVDHCHKSGKFRALLCTECNTAIGMIGENIETMNNAIAYMQGFVAEEAV